ncbi:unnamed protein product [Ectocarpus sp. 12 AP-2014]
MLSLSLSPSTSHPNPTRPTPTSFAAERIGFAPIPPSVFVETCQAFSKRTHALHDVWAVVENSSSAPAQKRTHVHAKHTALAKQWKTLQPNLGTRQQTRQQRRRWPSVSSITPPPTPSV